MMRPVLASCCAVLLSLLHAGPATAEPVASKALFRDHFVRDAQLSPDGRRVALVTPLADVEALVSFDLENETFKTLAQSTDARVEWHRWISDDQLVLQFDQGLTRAYSYFTVGLDGRPIRHLDPMSGYPMNQGPEWYFPAAALGHGKHSVYARFGVTAESPLGRCDRGDKLDPGVRILPFHIDPQLNHVVLDRDCEIRVVVQTGKRRGNARLNVQHRESRDQDWQVVGDYRYPEAFVLPLAFEGDGPSMLALSNVGRDTVGLFRFDVVTAKLGEMLVGDPVYDVDDVLLGTDGYSVVGARFLDELPKSVWLDPSYAAIASALEGGPGLRPYDIQLSRDGKTALVQTRSRVDVGSYWLLDVETGGLRELFRKAEWIRPEQMAATRHVRFEARDGAVMDAYLTLASSTAGQPAPLIVGFRGEPFNRSDDHPFDNVAQFFGSRGYAFLRVDYRGSGTYPSLYRSAAWRSAGTQLQDDLIDAARWAVEEGLADADRICAFGAGLGGYAAIMAAIDEPALYRCVASVGALSDLNEKWYDRAWRFGYEGAWLQGQVGDYWSRKRQRRHASPIRRIDELSTPLLLAHGKMDRTVSWEHTDRLARALLRQGKDVEILYFEEEGRVFREKDKRVALYEQIATFVSRHLSPATVGGESWVSQGPQ